MRRTIQGKMPTILNTKLRSSASPHDDVVRAFRTLITKPGSRQYFEDLIGDFGVHRAFYANWYTLIITTKVNGGGHHLNLACTKTDETLLVHPFSSSKRQIEYLERERWVVEVEHLKPVEVVERFKQHVATIASLQDTPVDKVKADRACFIAAGLPPRAYTAYLEGKPLAPDVWAVINHGYKYMDDIREQDEYGSFPLKVKTMYEVLLRLSPLHNTKSFLNEAARLRNSEVYRYLSGQCAYPA